MNYLRGIHTLFLLFSFLFQVNARNVPALNEISFAEIAITRTSGTVAGASFSLAGTPKSLIAALGKPQAITTEFSEIDNLNMTVYAYRGAKFYFNANALTGFNITGTGFSVRTSSTLKNQDRFSLKVGDAGSKVRTTYPISYKGMRDGKVFLMLFKTATKGAPAGTSDTTIYLDDMIVLDMQGGKISSIYY